MIHEPVAIAFGGRFFEILLQVSEDAAEAGFASARFAVQEKILNLVGEFFEGRVEIDSMCCGHDLQA